MPISYIRSTLLFPTISAASSHKGELTMRVVLAAAAIAAACLAVPAQAAPIMLGFTVNASGTRDDYVACPPGPGPTPAGGWGTCSSISPFSRSFSFSEVFTFTNGLSNYHSGFPTTGAGEITFTLRELGGTTYQVEDFSYYRTSNISASGYVPGGFSETARAPTLAVSSVPEPATWALMILGFGAIGASLRRKVSYAALPSCICP